MFVIIKTNSLSIKFAMKYIYLFLIAVLFTSCAGSGAVTSTIKKDAITGEESLVTSEVALQNSMTENIGTNLILLSGMKLKNARVLVFDMRRVGTTNVSGYIDANDLVQIKTSDDEVYELKAIKSVTPSYTVGNYGVTTWNIRAVYEVPEDTFNKLLSSQVTLIRVNISEGFLDSPISEKYAPRFKEVLTQLK